MGKPGEPADVARKAAKEFKVGQRVKYRGAPFGPLSEEDHGTVARLTRRGIVVQFDHLDDGYSLLNWNLEAVAKPPKPRPPRRRTNHA